MYVLVKERRLQRQKNISTTHRPMKGYRPVLVGRLSPLYVCFKLQVVVVAFLSWTSSTGDWAVSTGGPSCPMQVVVTATGTTFSLSEDMIATEG